MLLIAWITSVSEAEELRFHRFSGSDELLGSWVRCFYQDDTGMMWVGTSDCLGRFDGRIFKRYRPQLAADGGEVNVTVNDVEPRRDGKLLVASDSGLLVFDPIDFAFTPLGHLGNAPVTEVNIDSKGRYWVSTTEGLARLSRDFEIERFYVAGEGDLDLSDNYVNSTFESSDGRIFIGTKSGLNIFDEKQNRVIRYAASEREGALSSNDVLDIEEDEDGRIWLALARTGLELFNPLSGEFRNVLDGHGIRVVVDSEEMLWLTQSAGGGLVRLDTSRISDEVRPESLVETYRNRLGDKWSLADDTLYSVYEDHLGDIWIGTFGAGVSFYSKRAKSFHRISKSSAHPERSLQENMVTSFFEEEDYFWVGTVGGLERFDKRTGETKRFQSDFDDESTLGGNPIYSICKDSRGNLWVGGWITGLNRFDYEEERFVRYMKNDDDPVSLGANTVYSIYEDSRRDLWIATLGGGLNRYNYETDDFSRFVNEEDDEQSISSDYLNDIVEMPSGHLYVSTYESLDRYDHDQGAFKRIGHTPQTSNGSGGGKIIDLFRDSAGRLWLATTAGLEYFDEAKESFVTFRLSDGLPSESIQSMLEDDEGSLWIGTSDGLAKFEGAVENPSTGTFKSVSELDGLSSNKFNKRATWKSEDGTMYFGTSGGYTYFQPEEIAFNQVAPPIVVTEVQVLESNPDFPASYQPYRANVAMLGKLDLDYTNSSIAIRFAALNYLNPTSNSYRYQLSGYDKGWISAGNDASVTYTGLPPGEYVFRVAGSNNDGVWSNDLDTLVLTVSPPWWANWWAKALLVLICLLLFVLFYWIRFSIHREQRRMLEKRVQERTAKLEAANLELAEKRREIETQYEELHVSRDQLEKRVKERTRELENAKLRAEESDQLKSSFLMNMSHEIRTPMNAILGFSELLKSEGLSDQERDEFLEVISKNGRALLVLIDDILDVSLIQSGRVRLDSETFFVDEILIELKDYYGLKVTKDVRIALENTEHLSGLKIYADPVRFRQVLNNLLGNALKFTEKGKIAFGAKVEKRSVVFHVSDTGPGIAEEDQERIFEHFYKVEDDSGKMYPGTGLGLSICRRLINNMGGTIWVDSAKGQGTTFYFTLPLSDDRVDDEPFDIGDEKWRLEGLTLLVAEDEEANYALIEFTLKHTGAKLVRAKNGAEAVAFVKENPWSPNLIVLMDIKMPVMDGSEACRIIKKINPDLPIIAVTAFAQNRDREHFRKSGFDGYLTKPILPADLLAIVSAYAPNNDF